jgi:ferritin-like metal-binding protein YciE
MSFKKSAASLAGEEEPVHETGLGREYMRLFTDELKAIYWTEKQLTRARSRMAKLAVAPELKRLISDQLVNSQARLERLEQVFDAAGESARAKKSEAMAALIEEGKLPLPEKSTLDGHLRDASLLATTQKMQQHQVAGYQHLLQLAKSTNNEDAVAILEELLSEEREANDALASLSDQFMDRSAGPVEPEERPAAVYDSINLDGKTDGKKR